MRAGRFETIQYAVLPRILIGAYLLLIAPAFAQPANDSPYDLDSTIEIEGGLAQVALNMPGSSEFILYVIAADKNGENHQWTVVLGNANELTRAGMTMRSFAPGQKLVITGNPSLDSSDHRMLAKTVRRPDGSVWSR